jgi:Icc-related predicted phosphoesterase
MKLVLISDTHNRHNHLTSVGMGNILPEGDLLIHSGDLTGVGHKGEVESVFKWFKEVAPRYTHGVAFIAGNHDRSFDPKFNDGIQKPDWLLEKLSSLPSNIHYLENSDITINGVKIWGSPVSPWFHGDRWAFNVHRGADIWEVWDQISNDTDIVVTHGPVAYKLDYIPSQNVYVGCEQLRVAMDRVKPIIHTTGHIHESYGYEYGSNGVNYFNASICDEYYLPNNKPWEVELNLESREISGNFII